MARNGLTSEQLQAAGAAGGRAAAAALTPEQRRMCGQMGAAASWARTVDRSARTAKARAGLRARFEREIDPGGALPPETLAQTVDQAFKAWMLQLSWKASRNRSKAAWARREAAELETEAATAETELGELDGAGAA